jgi:predicted ATPase
LAWALSDAERIGEIGRAQDEIAFRLLGHSLRGTICFHLGEYVEAHALFEQCDGLDDPACRDVYGGLVTIDPYAVTLAYRALTSIILGFIDQARSRLHEALRVARRLGHAHTLTVVLTYVAEGESMIGSSHEAQSHADEVVALSTEHGFPQFVAMGNALRGSYLAARGNAQEGLALITGALSMLSAAGTITGTPSLLTALARAHKNLRQPVEALKRLAEAEQFIQATGERSAEAALHRLRGDVLFAAGDQLEAEHSYDQSFTVAKRQSAKLFELHAAKSIARLWRDQGRGPEARDLLAPIYDWFTEGFDTPVLQDAKALLDELA